MKALALASKNIQAEWQDFRHALSARPAPKYNWDPYGARTFAYRFVTHLVAEHQSPSQVGWAVFWGVLIGTTPFFGFHLLICLAISFLLRLNKLIVYAAANISIPIIAPFLIFASYQTGHYIFQGTFAELSVEALQQHGTKSLAYWVVGSFVFGSALGSVAGFVVFLTLRIIKRERTPFHESVAKLQAGFLVNGRMAAGIAKGKTSNDPIYQELLPQINANKTILDLGGGLGYLCLLHTLLYKTDTKHTVVDYDENKISQGIAASHELGIKNVRFETADVFSLSTIPSADVVCLLDVLHYRPHAEQNKLLEQIAEVIKKGGEVYIRDMDADQVWRTKFTLFQERCSLALGLTRATELYPRSGSELASFLESLGYQVNLRPCWQGTPFSNILIKATKL